ncbi:MAG: hypothetical protein JW950_02480, partial [Deltaproteobacteria bacterium]|nr:hypothetical protein [Deltaproteobacteria bacterium]
VHAIHSGPTLSLAFAGAGCKGRHGLRFFTRVSLLKICKNATENIVSERMGKTVEKETFVDFSGVKASPMLRQGNKT